MSTVTTTNPEYYIIVKKENGKFELTDTTEGMDNATPPAKLINSDKNVVFPIKVVQGNNDMHENEFEVNGVKYSLDLNNAYTTYTDGILIDDDKFIEMHNAFTNNNNSNNSNSSALTNNNNNNNSNSNSNSTDSALTNNNNNGDLLTFNGGKKQKQRRSKRNYSKKQRKQWAKNNTLRNYIKETHGIHSP
jgi:hypothetical protein